MTVILNAVLPLFGLILLGYVSARRQILGPGAVDNLNKFVVWLALPALLFQVMAQITWDQVNQPGFVMAFSLGMALVFSLSCLLGRRQRRHLADVSIQALAASYANAGFMGIPLCIMVLGESSLAPTIVAVLLTACVLFAFSIVLIEIGQHRSGSIASSGGKVLTALMHNPLVVSPLLGALFAALLCSRCWCIPLLHSYWYAGCSTCRRCGPRPLFY